LLLLTRFPLLVEPLRKFKDDKERGRESEPRYRSDFLREHVDNGQSEKSQGDQPQPDRYFGPSYMEIKWHFPFPRFGLFVAQHQYGERFHRKAPHHSERVSFSQKVHITATDKYRYDL